MPSAGPDPSPQPRRLTASRGRPPHRIWLRESSVGGPVADASFIPGDLVTRFGTGALTLLIHGFATDREGADTRYAAFRACFGERLREETVDVYWPGDWATAQAQATERRDWASAALSVAAYPLQLRRAEHTAQRLMTRLNEDLIARAEIAVAAGQAPTRLSLRIVAHSLGCLLSLELLKALRPLMDRDLRLDLVVLMAAAVPQYRLHPDDFGAALGKARQVRVYRSYNDWTLAAIFPLGQMLENPFPTGWWGPRRVAVGRHGCGAAKLPNAIEREVGHGHGGYWFDPALAREVAGAHRPSALAPFGRDRGAMSDLRPAPAPRIVAGRAGPQDRRPH